MFFIKTYLSVSSLTFNQDHFCHLFYIRIKGCTTFYYEVIFDTNFMDSEKAFALNQNLFN